MSGAAIIWRLAWTELNYRRRRILGSYLFVLVFALLRWLMQVGGGHQRYAEIPSHLSVVIHLALIVNLILALGLFSTWRAERREQMLVALPLSRATLFHGRLLALGLLPLLPFLGLVLGCLLVSGVEAWAWDGTILVPAYPIYPLAANGWTALYLLGLGYYTGLLGMLVYSRRKPVWINVVLWFLLLLISNLLVYPAGSSHNVFLPGIHAPATPLGALVMLAMIGALVLLNHHLYTRRHGVKR